MARFVVILLLIELIVYGISANTCPRRGSSPAREILCYTSTFDTKSLEESICRCTSLVHQGHDVQNVQLTDFENIRKSVKELNPVVQFILSINDAQKILTTSAQARQKAVAKITSILNEVDGIELNVTAGTKERLVHFVENLKEEMTRKSKERRIFVALPTKSEELAKQFDIKKLSKYVDLFTIPTHYLMEDTEKFATFHPSRLMGLFDLMNTDSLVDLVHGLGAIKKKILISLPASGYKFNLQFKNENTLKAPTKQKIPIVISQKQICDFINKGQWTIERDDDLTAPYAFNDETWIAFEDETSAGIKAKYTLLRDLAGIAIRNVEHDVKSNCWKTITQVIYQSFTDNKRKTRQAVWSSLQDDVHNTQNSYPDNLKSSNYRITRVVDMNGEVQPIREDTKTHFSCTHQGYFVNPKSCNRFYRCVKFNQWIEEYSVFEFDCPVGLAFDERTEVCVWPGSLEKGSPCLGSPEIAPSTKQKFQCPGPGYYADPQNCRWFFACMDLGAGRMTAYEFQCPYGLVFHESKLICEWPWLVPSCADKGYEHQGNVGVSVGTGSYGDNGGYGVHGGGNNQGDHKETEHQDYDYGAHDGQMGHVDYYDEHNEDGYKGHKDPHMPDGEVGKHNNGDSEKHDYYDENNEDAYKDGKVPHTPDSQVGKHNNGDSGKHDYYDEHNEDEYEGHKDPHMPDSEVGKHNNGDSEKHHYYDEHNEDGYKGGNNPHKPDSEAGKHNNGDSEKHDYYDEHNEDAYKGDKDPHTPDSDVGKHYNEDSEKHDYYDEHNEDGYKGGINSHMPDSEVGKHNNGDSEKHDYYDEHNEDGYKGGEDPHKPDSEGGKNNNGDSGKHDYYDEHNEDGYKDGENPHNPDSKGAQDNNGDSGKHDSKAGEKHQGKFNSDEEQGVYIKNVAHHGGHGDSMSTKASHSSTLFVTNSPHANEPPPESHHLPTHYGKKITPTIPSVDEYKTQVVETTENTFDNTHKVIHKVHDNDDDDTETEHVHRKASESPELGVKNIHDESDQTKPGIYVSTQTTPGKQSTLRFGNTYYTNQVVGPYSSMKSTSNFYPTSGKQYYTNEIGKNGGEHFDKSRTAITPAMSITTTGNRYYTNQAGITETHQPDYGGYKTNEYHDNGGRSTIRYNNGIVTQKYTEDDIRDLYTSNRVFSATQVTKSNDKEYTKKGFSKIGPTKTGITTAQVGGSGSYVISKVTPSRPSPTSGDFIGENAFGTLDSSNSFYKTTTVKSTNFQYNTNTGFVRQTTSSPYLDVHVYNGQTPLSTNVNYDETANKKLTSPLTPISITDKSLVYNNENTNINSHVTKNDEFLNVGILMKESSSPVQLPTVTPAGSTRVDETKSRDITYDEIDGEFGDRINHGSALQSHRQLHKVSNTAVTPEIGMTYNMPMSVSQSGSNGKPKEYNYYSESKRPFNKTRTPVISYSPVAPSRTRDSEKDKVKNTFSRNHQAKTQQTSDKGLFKTDSSLTKEFSDYSTSSHYEIVNGAGELSKYERKSTMKSGEADSTTQLPAVTKQGKAKGRIVVKFSDLHPILLQKLGAECTCKANPFIDLNKRNKPLLIDSSRGTIDLRNYDESDVYVDLEHSHEHDYNDEFAGLTTRISRIQTPSVVAEFDNRGTKLGNSKIPTFSSSLMRIAASDIEASASYSSDELRSRAGKSLENSAKIRVLELNTLQKTAEHCARPGLFRHPKLCNKFYACHWDNWSNKFTLHIFDCPVHLTFDNQTSACNWPSKGPACQDNNILL